MKCLPALFAALLLSTPAFAQSGEPAVPTPAPAAVAAPTPAAPVRGPFTSALVWGGLATEVFILPGPVVGVSVPVADRMAVRLNAEAIVFPFNYGALLPVANTEVLFGNMYGDMALYAGPSVGALLNVGGRAWLLGGVAGTHRAIGDSGLGWYAEARLRYGTDFQTSAIFMPGLSMGLTVWF